MPTKILIIDDDLETLKLTGTVLEQQGYEIIAAKTGAQALDKAGEEQPDLIVLDIMMPDMDGYEVLRRLRADPQTANTPIIMFTAKVTVDDKVAGFEAGADDFLTKPTHPAELASRVKNLLSRSAKRPSAAPSKLGRIASFIGVKGGVGTTTLALNTAAAMSQLVGGGVALAEMRPGQGSVGLMLGFARPQGLGNLLSKGHAGLTTRNVEGELVRHKSGVSLLMSAPLHDEKEANYSPEAAEILVRGLAATVAYVVLDLGNGLSPENQRLATISEQVIVCLEPQRVAIAQAQQMLEELNVLGLGPGRTNAVLISRTPSSLQTSWQSVQQTLQKELLAIISPAPELAFQALEERAPMVQLQPGNITSGQFHKLGETLIKLMGPAAEPVD